MSEQIQHEINKFKSEILNLKNEINKQRNINQQIKQRFQLLLDEVNNIKDKLGMD